jgi:hypothetical protein
MPYFTFFVMFSRSVLPNCYPALFEEGFSWPPPPLRLNPCDYFLWGCLEDKAFRKNPYTIPETKTAIQSETETISSETLTNKVLHNFVLRLHKVRDPRGHQMEDVLVY